MLEFDSLIIADCEKIGLLVKLGFFKQRIGLTCDETNFEHKW